MTGASGERPLRPFPVLDPEPPRRFTWRSVRWTAVGCVLAAAVVAVVLLTWPSSSSSQVQVPARFVDGDGLVVFEQQPSGLLGTAAPDGSHRLMLTKVGALQGTDLPVASSDGRYLVNQEGQLVTMGPAGPTSVSTLTQPVAAQTSGSAWMDASFADGSRYVEATECYAQNSGTTQSWVADLVPTVGGPDRVLGTVTDSAGDPASAGAFEAAPTSPWSATSGDECWGQQQVSDKALELLQPGQAPHTIVTAVELDRVLGVPPGTSLQLSALPSPDGGLLALNVTVGTPLTVGEALAARHDLIMMTREGKVVADIRLPAGTGTERWSPDGHQIAFGEVTGTASSVTVWAVGRQSRTITLPGRHDIWCDQLLWSPDGGQLIYAAQVTEKGLTQADRLQHGWTVINLRTGQVHDVTAPGQPAAWLPTVPATRPAVPATRPTASVAR